jgi:hypothetical protein
MQTSGKIVGALTTFKRTNLDIYRMSISGISRTGDIASANLVSKMLCDIRPKSNVHRPRAGARPSSGYIAITQHTKCSQSRDGFWASQRISIISTSCICTFGNALMWKIACFRSSLWNVRRSRTRQAQLNTGKRNYLKILCDHSVLSLECYTRLNAFVSSKDPRTR